LHRAAGSGSSDGSDLALHTRPRVPTRRLVIGFLAAALIAAGAFLWAIMKADSGMPRHAATGERRVAAGSATRFAYLAAHHSNYCNLDPATVAGYPDDQRMQGACCDPMDMNKYDHQVAKLRRYASIGKIPTDPYDIQAGQAKHLLAYDRTITLTGPDQATFDAAMQMTDDHGPCCCQCWRWYMTEGLDKYLITSRHLAASQVADITELVNGCGGPLGSSPSPTDMAPRPS
jgi:hypothetical protein